MALAPISGHRMDIEVLEMLFNRLNEADSLSYPGLFRLTGQPASRLFAAMVAVNARQVGDPNDPLSPPTTNKIILRSPSLKEEEEEEERRRRSENESNNDHEEKKKIVEYRNEKLREMKELMEEHTPVTIATQLKKYMREAVPPVIPFDMYEPLLRVQQIASPSERLKAFRECLQNSLPEYSKEILHLLLPHLLRVDENAKENQMNLDNLSKMLTPTLMRNYPHIQLLDPNVIFSEISVVVDLLRWHNYLFAPDSSDLPNLNNEEKKFQRDRKRKTMALFAMAEVPDKFLILDNSKPSTVLLPTESQTLSPPRLSPRSSNSSSGPTPPPSPRSFLSSNQSSSSSSSSSGPTPPPSPRSPKDSTKTSPQKMTSQKTKEASSSSSSSSTSSSTSSSSSSSWSSTFSSAPSHPLFSLGSSKIGVSRQTSFFTAPTYHVSFGTLSSQRTLNDFNTFHYFLTHNYPHLSFPALPKAKSSAKKIAMNLDLFLKIVTGIDELFMDSLFVERWLQFVGSKTLPTTSSESTILEDSKPSPRH